MQTWSEQTINSWDERPRTNANEGDQASWHMLSLVSRVVGVARVGCQTEMTAIVMERMHKSLSLHWCSN